MQIRAPAHTPTLLRPRHSSKNRVILACALGCKTNSAITSANFANMVAVLHEFTPPDKYRAIARYGGCGFALPFFYFSTF